MRTLTQFGQDESTRQLLDILTEETTSPSDYREAMTALGGQMAIDVLRLTHPDARDTVCVVCTVEDADFLAKGLIDGLHENGVDASRLKLICFWNERVSHFWGENMKLFDVAPIIKEYREDIELHNSILVVVKSIISGACVVKTNLATLIDRALPKRIVVAAPVMLEGAEKRLELEFSEDTAQLFEYLTFAIDTEKGDDDNVIPGIGGSVYERLGFKDKNSYVPDIVKLRRKAANVLKA